MEVITIKISTANGGLDGTPIINLVLIKKEGVSGPIRMGKMKRNDALKEISSPPAVKKEITDFVIKKLDLSNEEFIEIMKQKCRSYKNFKTGLDILIKFKFIIKIFNQKRTYITCSV